jgi:uncharacterized protein
MTWLLDVNALIAACVAGHEHHARVEAWLAGLSVGDSLATSSITELGFVRVLNQAPQYRVPVREAVAMVKRLHAVKTRPVRRLEDALGVGDLPGWVGAGRQLTDGHLTALAAHHGARLATLDAGIPGAFLIP